jgi:hypothetical protein
MHIEDIEGIEGIERRCAPRYPVAIYFNKYIDGHPYLAEVLELSTSGMLVRAIHEPDAPRACYAVEIEPTEGERLWLCGTPVWTSGPFQALGFVGQSDADRARLQAMIDKLPR